MSVALLPLDDDERMRRRARLTDQVSQLGRIGAWEVVGNEIVLTDEAARLLAIDGPSDRDRWVAAFTGRAQSALRDALEANVAFRLEVPFHDRWLEIEGEPCEDGGLRGTIHDVTAVTIAHLEARSAEERRARLWESLTLAEEEQRRSIARELHDQAGSSLASTLVRCRLIEGSKAMPEVRRHVERLATEISQVMDCLARLSRGLHPVSLEDLGLGVALERLGASVGELHGLVVSTTIDLPGTPPKLVGLAMYRMVQEALRNTVMHARARNVVLSARQADAGLRVEIVDDGAGFDAGKIDELFHQGKLGLAGIRERAAMLGGKAEIGSRPGEGTRIEICVPWTTPAPPTPSASLGGAGS